MDTCNHGHLTEREVDLRFCAACGELIEYFADDTLSWVKVS